jgi:hypothetical protein
MPKKEKEFRNVIFTPEAITEVAKALESRLGRVERRMGQTSLNITSSSGETWELNSENEFFAEYRKGFDNARFGKFYGLNHYLTFWVWRTDTSVTVSLNTRDDIEQVFSIVEKNVDKCRLPKQPKGKTESSTDWITVSISKIETHCPLVARKLKLALNKLESEDVEEWQNATVLIRDAWIQLTQWLCEVNGIDTSDISRDAVVDRLKKLKIDKTDERLFNLARASFNLYGKHHKRDIDLDTAVACVVSTIVSMKTVIKESFDATG